MFVSVQILTSAVVVVLTVVGLVVSCQCLSTVFIYLCLFIVGFVTIVIVAVFLF